MNASCDVVVVGAGLTGLTAAAFLRRAGRRVVVVDPSPPGGRGRTDELGGALRNRGPHALYLGGPAEGVLRELGVRWTGARSGRLHLSRGGMTGTLMRSPMLGARGRVALAGAFARVRCTDPGRLAGRPFGAWVGSLGLPDDAAAVLLAMGRIATYAHAPDVVDAGAVVAQIRQASGPGVRYLDGGWQSLVDQLTAVGDVLRATATAVRADGGRVTVTTSCGDVVAPAAVVAVATPAAAATLLGGAPFTAGPPIEAACLDLVTSRHAACPVLLGLDEPLYLSDHGAVARLAPAGRSVVHVARYLAPGEDHDPAATRRALEAHAGLAGVPADAVVDARYLHRMTVAGALPLAEHGGLRGRPEASGVDGVFLAGDWVGPAGHLLDAAMASARRAAERADRLVG